MPNTKEAQMKHQEEHQEKTYGKSYIQMIFDDDVEEIDAQEFIDNLYRLLGSFIETLNNVLNSDIYGRTPIEAAKPIADAVRDSLNAVYEINGVYDRAQGRVNFKLPKDSENLIKRANESLKSFKETVTKQIAKDEKAKKIISFAKETAQEINANFLNAANSEQILKSIRLRSSELIRTLQARAIVAPDLRYVLPSVAFKYCVLLNQSVIVEMLEQTDKDKLFNVFLAVADTIDDDKSIKDLSEAELEGLAQKDFECLHDTSIIIYAGRAKHKRLEDEQTIRTLKQWYKRLFKETKKEILKMSAHASTRIKDTDETTQVTRYRTPVDGIQIMKNLSYKNKKAIKANDGIRKAPVTVSIADQDGRPQTMTMADLSYMQNIASIMIANDLDANWKGGHFAIPVKEVIKGEKGKINNQKYMPTKAEIDRVGKELERESSKKFRIFDDENGNIIYTDRQITDLYFDNKVKRASSEYFLKGSTSFMTNKKGEKELYFIIDEFPQFIRYALVLKRYFVSPIELKNFKGNNKEYAVNVSEEINRLLHLSKHCGEYIYYTYKDKKGKQRKKLAILVDDEPRKSGEPNFFQRAGIPSIEEQMQSSTAKPGTKNYKDMSNRKFMNICEMAENYLDNACNIKDVDEITGEERKDSSDQTMPYIKNRGEVVKIPGKKKAYLMYTLNDEDEEERKKIEAKRKDNKKQQGIKYKAGKSRR